ncbi:MAG: alpha/beta hydrolase [Alphaproteobacteria bacterium]
MAPGTSRAGEGARLEPYPPQEPLDGRMYEYQAELLARGLGIVGEEHAYGPSRLQRIEVFAPRRPNGTILVAFPGGGWTNAYKEFMSHMAPAMVESGAILVTAGYRLAPDDIFPACADDCGAAVVKARDAAAKLGGDPDRIFLTGHSAGGHLAALLAVTSSGTEPTETGAFGLSPGDIRGCMPISGSYDLTPAGGYSNRPRFLGRPGNERLASPIHRIGASALPFLLAIGENDFPHLVAQADAFAAALDARGVDLERITLAGEDHFTAGWAGMPGSVWTRAAIDWMARK